MTDVPWQVNYCPPVADGLDGRLSGGYDVPARLYEHRWSWSSSGGRARVYCLNPDCGAQFFAVFDGSKEGMTFQEAARATYRKVWANRPQVP